MSKDPLIYIRPVDVEDNSTDLDEPIEIYCEQTDLDQPYRIDDLVHINATDYTGLHNLSQRLKIKTNRLNFKKIGDYTIPVSVIDEAGNLAISYFVIHVVPATVSEVSRETRQKKKINLNFFDKDDMRLLSWGICALFVACLIYYFAEMFI